MPWVLLIVAALVAVLAAFGFESGSCFGVDADGALICTTEPTMGWAGAWVIAGIAVAISAYAMWRIVRLDLRRGGRGRR